MTAPKRTGPASRWERLRDRLSSFDRQLWSTLEGPRPKWYVFFQRWLQIIQRSIFDFFSHEAPTSASALTYATLLSFVPLLALVMAGLTVFGMQDRARVELKNHPVVYNLGRPTVVEKSVSGEILSTKNLTPTTSTVMAVTPSSATMTTDAATTGSITIHPQFSGPAIVDRVFDAVERANLQKLGPLGIIGLLWAVMTLFSRIERAMNRAWSVRRSRTLTKKIGDYFNLLIICILILLAMTATTSSYVLKTLEEFNRYHIPGIYEIGSLVLKYIAYVIIWPAFTILYFAIPNAKVRWRSAVAGGVIAGTVYQLMQLFFVISSGLLIQRYGKIYGSVAIMFVVFFWIYTSWCVLLWGAEICAAHQNLRKLRRQRREWHDTPYEYETLGLRLAALLAAPMINGSKHARMDEGDLADALKCPPEPLASLLELFRQHHVCIQSADDGTFTLARSPEGLMAADVLRLVREGSLRPAEDSTPECLGPLQRKTLGELANVPIEEIDTVRY